MSSSALDRDNPIDGMTVAVRTSLRTATIGVDVGGTKIAAAVVDRSGTLLAVRHRPTPADDVVQIRDVIAEMVRDLRAEHDVSAVGVAAAGFVDAERSTVMFAPNLPWRGEPLRRELERRTGLPVVVENDANSAAWAEARFGAGRGERHLVALTVGTGVGGGIVEDGALVRGRFGAAAEVGHVVMVPGGRPCPCGLRGCLEQYASGRALGRRAQEIASASPRLAQGLLERVGGRVDGIDGAAVTAAAQAGDAVSLRAFDEIGGWLGRGLAQLAAVLDPGMFVLAGGVTNAGQVLLEPVMAGFADSLTARDRRPLARVALAGLGPEAGIVGAADLAADADLAARADVRPGALDAGSAVPR